MRLQECQRLVQDRARGVVDEVGPQADVVTRQISSDCRRAIGVAAQIAQCAGLVVDERAVQLLMDQLSHRIVAVDAAGGRRVDVYGLAGRDSLRQFAGLDLGRRFARCDAAAAFSEPATLRHVDQLVCHLLA